MFVSKLFIIKKVIIAFCIKKSIFYVIKNTLKKSKQYIGVEFFYDFIVKDKIIK